LQLQITYFLRSDKDKFRFPNAFLKIIIEKYPLSILETNNFYIYCIYTGTYNYGDKNNPDFVIIKTKRNENDNQAPNRQELLYRVEIFRGICSDLRRNIIYFHQSIFADKAHQKCSMPF